MRYRLTLYIAADDPLDRSLYARVETTCTDVLPPGTWALNWVDITKEPEVARDMQLVAVPLLIINAGGHARRVVGRFLDESKLRETLLFYEQCHQQSVMANGMVRQANEMANQARQMSDESRKMLNSRPSPQDPKPD